MKRPKAIGAVIALVALTVMPATGSAAAPAIPVTYTAQGPGPMTGGQVEGIGAQNNPVVGAIHTVAAHPTNANQLWIGTVNGGIWRTSNATAASPAWQPLTDEQVSLSISALEMDPTIATNLVLVAGMGNYSSIGGIGGARAGLLRTTNGGNSWTQLGATDLNGQRISGVAARGATMVASANNGGGGIFRSTNTGASFTRLSGNGSSGLPGNAAFDLAGDPGNAQRLYAATSAGLFRSDNTGATWANVSGSGAGTPGATIGGTTNNIEIAVHNSAGANAVYAGVVNNGQLAGLFRSADQGANWTQLDTPQTIEGGTPIGLQPRVKPGSQGGTHFSILADRASANLVYLGGDRQPLGAGPDGVLGNTDDNWPNSIGAQDYTGRLFRCDATLAAGAQCTNFTHGNANGSSPHADSREMVWDANGDIVETDDGGIYRQTDPAANNGRWVSVNGNLQIAESHSCDYDSVANVIMCGNQDTGVPEQVSAGSTTWREVTTADGGTVAIDDNNAAQSIRYYSNQNFGNLSRRTCNAANTCNSTSLPLTVAGSGGQNLFQFDTTIQFYGPLEVNAVAANRLVLGTNRLYESADQGSNITDLTGNTGSGLTEAIAYGGRSGGMDNPDVLYYGNGAGLFVRTSAGAAFAALTAYPGGVPSDIVLDSDDWLTAYVTDGTAVYRTDDAGTTWADITGDLFEHNPGSLLSLAFIPAAGFDGIVVGTTRGVFATHTRSLGRWAEFGPGIPNTHAFDVRYDGTDNVLMVGTLGRGAWLVSNASTAFPTADLRVSKSGTPDPVIAGEELFYTVTITNDGPATAFGAVAVDELPDQLTYLSSTGSCSLNATTNDLTCAAGDIPNGQSRSFTVKTRVNADTVAFDSDGTVRIDNRVVASTASADPDPADDVAITSTFVQERADLAVTKLCVPNTSIPAGQTASCTVYVDNYGPSYARDVTITDTHTGNGSFTIVSATPTIGSCSIAGGTVSCNLGVVAAASPSQPGRQSAEVRITANEAMSVDDIAKAVAATPDPNNSNNQREDTLSFSASANLRLAKTGPASAIAGTNIVYQLTVTNDGPSAAAAVMVQDALPSQVSVVSVSGSGGASCLPGTPGDNEAPATCSFGTLASGATQTMTITVKIKPEMLGAIHNNAKASSSVFDPDLASNLASVTTIVTADADLKVAIAATPNPVIAGDALSYQITAGNNGPSLAGDVTLTVPLPATLKYTSSVVSPASGSCALQTNTNTLQCQLGDLTPGESFVVTVLTVAASATPSGAVISTTATVSSQTPDSLPGNNSATAQTSVITSADLAISLTSDRNNYGLLSTIHYTITVTNNGLSDARNVVVTQQMPEHHKAIYKANDAGCAPPDHSGKFTCNLGTVRAGDTKTFQISLKTATILCTISQTATVRSDEPDPWPPNNTDTRIVTVLLL